MNKRVERNVKILLFVDSIPNLLSPKSLLPPRKEERTNKKQRARNHQVVYSSDYHRLNTATRLEQLQSLNVQQYNVY